MNSKSVRVMSVVAVLHAGAAAQSVFTWNGASPATSPVARFGHAMVYDSQRHRIVLFGGYTGNANLGDTWEWDGTAWLARFSSSFPTAREGHAMAYDSQRGKTVLFGGAGSAETWEWSGSAWAHVIVNGPPSRRYHAMVYDSQRGKTVLFGGQGASGDAIADTWEWDGTTWTQVIATGPAGRQHHAMAYDSLRGKTVLFGGWNSGSTFADTWEWDGNSWAQMLVAGPSVRHGHAMTYDDQRGRVVLFGGYYHHPSIGNQLFNDTWDWNGATWINRSSTGPFKRLSHALAYDGLHGRAVLFGGVSYPSVGNQLVLSDTWLLNANDAAFAIPFGSGCGSPPVALVPDPAQRPLSGQTCGATVVNSPTPFGAMMIGFSNQSYGPFALPATLAGLDMPGCYLLQSADIMGFPVTPLTPTTMAFSAFLPPTPSLVGAHVYLQAYVLAPSANPFGLLVSNGIDWFVGNV